MWLGLRTYTRCKRQNISIRSENGSTKCQRYVKGHVAECSFDRAILHVEIMSEKNEW